MLKSWSTVIVVNNLILGSLSGTCSYTHYTNYGPIPVNTDIECPLWQVDFADIYVDFECLEPSLNVEPVPFSTTYFGSECTSDTQFAGSTTEEAGDCSLPDTGCNIYEVELKQWFGDDGCAIIDPDDDCNPTCDIGFPQNPGSIIFYVTDGGSNKCLQTSVDESVLYSDISVENGFFIEKYDNTDCSGAPFDIVDYSPGCRKESSNDSSDIIIKLIDPAETDQPSKQPTEEPQ